MINEQILIPLKVDLQISASALDDYLLSLIATAKERIDTEGIKLTESEGDGMLVCEYAAYLYRQRREPAMAMPRSLRWALNNRLLAEKGSIDGRYNHAGQCDVY